VRLAGLLIRFVTLAVVGAASYVVASADHQRYLFHGTNFFPYAAGVLAVVAGLTAVQPKSLVAQFTRRTPQWELAVKRTMAPLLLQVLLAVRKPKLGQQEPCCEIDMPNTGLRVYLLRRPLRSYFSQTLVLSTVFDFVNADVDDWKPTQWAIGRAFTDGEAGWRRDVDWGGLGGSFTQAQWAAVQDKMGMTYQQARGLGDCSAALAFVISRTRRVLPPRKLGVLSLRINQECYDCIDSGVVAQFKVAAATIGSLNADGKS
jgi:hypothetical protein